MSISWAAHRTRLLLIIFAAVLAAAGVLALTSQGASARASGSHAFHWGGGPKPVIVLEHGAWADGSSWDRVVRRLQNAGFTVYAPPNPLRGLPSDSAYLHDFLTQNAALAGHPVVLVGHSYGGAVITNAAVGDPEVKALVFVDAFIPGQGETLGGLLASVPGSCLGGNPAGVFNFVPYPGGPPGDVDAYIKPSLGPRLLRQRPARPGGRDHRRHPAAAGGQHARRAVRDAGLEDHPVLGRHRRLIDRPSGDSDRSISEHVDDRPDKEFVDVAVLGIQPGTEILVTVRRGQCQPA